MRAHNKLLLQSFAISYIQLTKSLVCLTNTHTSSANIMFASSTNLEFLSGINHGSAAAVTTAAAPMPSPSGNPNPTHLSMAHTLEVTVPEQAAGNRNAQSRMQPPPAAAMIRAAAGSL